MLNTNSSVKELVYEIRFIKDELESLEEKEAELYNSMSEAEDAHSFSDEEYDRRYTAYYELYVKCQYLRDQMEVFKKGLPYLESMITSLRYVAIDFPEMGRGVDFSFDNLKGEIENLL